MCGEPRIDLSDARASVALGKVVPSKLWANFEEIRRTIVRYPAVDASDLAARLAEFVRGFDEITER
jgi:hypothetical protein